MKFIRFFLIFLATMAVLAAILVAAAFAPPVQTWFARIELDAVPGLRASIGSLSAGLGKVDVEDAKLQYGDAVLTLPSLQATLPVVDAAWHGKVLVTRLVAKGWTLDLSRIPEAARERALDAAAEDIPSQTPSAAKQAARVFTGILSGWRLPVDAALGAVDLEGDVLVAALPGREPIRVHVTATGGGAAAGREGAFEVSAQYASANPAEAQSASLHGRLLVAMESPRIVHRAEIKADVSATSGTIHEDLTLRASAGQAPSADGEAYVLELGRGSRDIAALNFAFSLATRRFDGSWRVHLQDSDVAPFAGTAPVPVFTFDGNGRFDADEAFAHLHATGRLDSVASRLGALTPALSHVGTATLGGAFDAVRTGRSIHVSRLDLSVAGDHPVILLQALQPFDFDEVTRQVKASGPGDDWLGASLHDFPLAWLPSLPRGLVFGVGSANAEYLLKASDGGYGVTPKGLITVTGASLQSDGVIVAHGLNLSLSLAADYAAKQFNFQLSHATLDSSGRQLATLEAKGSRPAGDGHSLSVTGTLKADLAAIGGDPGLPALGWVSGRSASCEFTGSFGSSADLQGNLVLVGRDPGSTVTTDLTVSIEAGGAWEVLAPLRIASGKSLTEISVEGAWGRQHSDPRIELKLSSENVALEQLVLLAAPLAAAGGSPLHGGHSPGKDLVPFWGDWVGTLSLAIDRLRTGDQDFTDVGGTFEFDHGSLQLEGGHGELPPKSLAKVEGSITFDPTAATPYTLSGTLEPVANLDSALLLPHQPGQDPMIEGHFTLGGTVSGAGTSLDDLIGQTREEFQLSSANGIVRLLATNIADAIPEAPEPVSDAADAVGDFVGSVLLGIKGHSLDPAKNKLGKSAEAVLNFTNQVSEIGFDKVTVTAVRGPDRSIRLTHLEMTAQDAHLVGTGEITYAKGLPISQEPLSLELQLGVRDVAAKLLSTVGLLSQGKDALGYPLLNQSIRFGGTLAHIDDKQWHDILAKAAEPKPAPAKK